MKKSDINWINKWYQMYTQLTSNEKVGNIKWTTGWYQMAVRKYRIKCSKSLLCFFSCVFNWLLVNKNMLLGIMFIRYT